MLRKLGNPFSAATPPQTPLEELTTLPQTL